MITKIFIALLLFGTLTTIAKKAPLFGSGSDIRTNFYGPNTDTSVLAKIKAATNDNNALAEAKEKAKEIATNTPIADTNATAVGAKITDTFTNIASSISQTFDKSLAEMKEKVPSIPDMPKMPSLPSLSSIAGVKEANAGVVRTSGKGTTQGQIYVGARDRGIDRGDVFVAAYPDLKH